MNIGKREKRMHLLTIFLPLSQDGDLFTSGQIEKEQHCFLTNDVCKVNIVNLRTGENTRRKQALDLCGAKP